MRRESGGLLLEAIVSFAVVGVLLAGIVGLFAYLQSARLFAAQEVTALSLARGMYDTWLAAASQGGGAVFCIPSPQNTAAHPCRSTATVGGVTYTETAAVPANLPQKSAYPVLVQVTWQGPLGRPGSVSLATGWSTSLSCVPHNQQDNPGNGGCGNSSNAGSGQRGGGNLGKP